MISQSTFEMGDGPLAINQGYYVDSCSSAVCHFCTNIIFCFVNGPNIWNLNMFLVHLHKQMQCGIHLELGKCTITVHIFLHTTAHFGKIINTSAIKNEQILVLEVFYKHSLFLSFVWLTFTFIFNSNWSPHSTTLQCFPHLACLVDEAGLSQRSVFSNFFCLA